MTQISSNIYIAHIDHRSVVLDLNRNRYIGLDANMSKAIKILSSSPFTDDQLSTIGEKTIYKLLNHGILVGTGQPKPRCLSAPESQSAVPLPTGSLWALLADERIPEERIPLASMTSAFVSLTQVAISLRIRSFKDTIGWLGKTKLVTAKNKLHSHIQHLGRAQALVDAFDEIRPYFPLKPICRLDAPSLCLHLRRNGQDAQLIFGVRLDPFKAHCWVQMGHVAISEAWDRIKQYTPILVV